MALTYSEMVPLGKKAPSIKLNDVYGKKFNLDECTGKKAYVVMFICKHCPYIVATQNRIAKLAKDLTPMNVQFIGICSNDAEEYPEDAPENLKKQAETLGFVFPYLVDTTQDVAKAYGAVATPDIFVFDSNKILKYRGRIDDSWKDESKVTKQELREAIVALVEGKEVNPNQLPSMGCSIKWKQN